MTGRERVLAAIEHRKTDRFPLSYEATYEVTASLIEHFGIHESVGAPSHKSSSNQPSASGRKYGMEHEMALMRILGIDQAIVSCPTNSQSTIGNWWGLPLLERLPDGSILGAWGIIFRELDYGWGSYLEIDRTAFGGERSLRELSEYPSPSLDLWDFDALEELLPSYGGYFRWLNMNGCFDFARFFRGTPELLMDMALEPEKAEVLLDKVNDLAIAFFSEAIGRVAGSVDGVYLGDDFGTQRGMVMSPGMWRSFIKPRYAKLIGIIKSHGLKYCHHSCGGIRPIIPDLIEIGVDVLNPIQPLAEGMEPGELGDAFGKDLTFWGGIDEQHTLPQGSVEDVWSEVRNRMDTLGKHGGYIVSPSHAFQPDTPLENVLAVYETVRGRAYG